MSDMNALLTAQQVADRLNVSKKWVYEMSAKGVLPAGKLGGHLRFLESDIERYIKDSFA